MKIISQHLTLIAMIFIASCSDLSIIFPKSSFDAPFPKRNINLTYVLGDQITIKTGTDTITLAISAFKENNLITYSGTNDTMFYGKVCRFRGLYYFNQQMNDSSYWIYAVRITDQLIYGLNTEWEQLALVDSAIEKGNHKKLVKYISSDKIRLHLDKRELKKLYAPIIDRIIPDTIIQVHEYTTTLNSTSKNPIAIDPEEFEYLSKAYPNPTADIVNIELQQNSNGIGYSLTNLKGQTLLNGQFLDIKNKIDLSNQPNGIYLLTLTNQATSQKETIKVIKK